MTARRETCRGRLLALALGVGAVLALSSASCEGDPLGASELAAATRVHSVGDAEHSYYQSHHKFAGLKELGPSGAKLIPGDLAGGLAGDYQFRLEVTDTGYTVEAHSDVAGWRPRRSFYSDETGVIRASAGPGPATRTSKRVDWLPGDPP